MDRGSSRISERCMPSFGPRLAARIWTSLTEARSDIVAIERKRDRESKCCAMPDLRADEGERESSVDGRSRRGD